MARKVAQPGKPAAPKGAAGANDLAVLQPDVKLSIGGKPLVVREYRYFEGLQLEVQAQPFFADLYAMFERDGSPPMFEDISLLLGKHAGLVVSMVAQAADCDPEWVRELDDQDGDALMVTWWLVNTGFFIRRVMRHAAQVRQVASRSGGRGSSTRSSKAATSEPPTTSPA